MCLFCQSGNKLKNYLHITESAPKHPVIYDSKRTVLSLPPIINGEHSKIRESTTNVFIECTGLDLTKLNVVINTMCAMFGQYTKTPFQIEPVKVIYEAESKRNAVYPDMSSRTVHVPVDYINSGTAPLTPFTPVSSAWRLACMGVALAIERNRVGSNNMMIKTLKINWITMKLCDSKR